MVRTAALDTPDTKSSLLEAAERLFAERGIAAASMRAITQAAGANLAAVHYHFGSKQGLVRAVLARRIEPLNRERLRRLAHCEGLDGRRAVESIVAAFVRPPLTMVRTEPGGRAFAQLVARAFLEPVGGTRELVLEQFREVIERFTAALACALPEVPREEILWRFHLMVGSMSFTLGLGFMVERFGGERPDDTDLVARRLVTFLSGGMLRQATPKELAR